MGEKAARLQVGKGAGTKSSLALPLLPSDPMLMRAFFDSCATTWDGADQADLGAARACTHLDCIN